VVILVGLGALAAACIDVTPIEAPGGPADASVDVSASMSVADSACFQCSSGAAEAGPGCGTELETCRGDAKCLALFLCGIPRGCYRPGQDLVVCLSACAVQAGVTGMDDPAVAPFIALHTCATTTCASACGGTAEAGVAPSKPVCASPLGATCPPIAGNCKGIGAPCTRGGGQCASVHALCDIDLDPRGAGMCMTVLCSPGECGSGATCCKSAATQNIALCMPNQCLPADCSADP